jgi:hypothetical protein
MKLPAASGGQGIQAKTNKKIKKLNSETGEYH